MHDLNTIKRLNAKAHERAIADWRNGGKYVVTVYDGLSLVVAEPYDTQEQALAALDKVKAVGVTTYVYPPIPPEQRVGHRDQSEDRGVSFASIDDYLRHTGQLK